MSKIKVNEIEKVSGSGITIPTGTSFTVTDGLAASTISSGTLADARLPTVPVSKGGTGLTSLGSAGQVVKVNSGASALEFGTISSPIKKTYLKMFKGGQSISGFSASSPSEVSNYNLTITPQSNTSVFLATYSVAAGSNSDHTFMQAVAKTGSGSYTKLGTGKANFYNSNTYFDFGSFYVGGDGNQVKVATHQFYYAPATTSAITFALFGGQHSSTAYFGRSSQNTTDDYTALGMTLRVDEYASTSDLAYTEYTSG